MRDDDKLKNAHNAATQYTLLLLFALLCLAVFLPFKHAHSTNTPTNVLKAAQFYEGYYLSKTRGFYDFCKQQGSDTTPYINKYKKVEKSAFNKVNSILKGNKLVFGKDYKSHRNEMLKILEQEMEKVRKTFIKEFNNPNISMKDICDAYNHTSIDQMKGFSFSVERPDLYKTLINHGSSTIEPGSNGTPSFIDIDFNGEIQLKAPSRGTGDIPAKCRTGLYSLALMRLSAGHWF